VEADLRVALGDVSYHYFAGFGGGRKLVFPGLGEPDGILANHKLSLDVEGRLHPACEPGRLDGNPVHEDLMEAVSFCPPDLLVQWVEAEPGGPTLLEVGDWREQHAAGCAVYLRGHRLGHTTRPRALLVDAGGHPRDATFLQAHKSLQHAARFLPDGGRLLLVAGLREGVGSAVLERLWGRSSGELAQLAREHYELHTHTALAFATVRERCEVGVWTAGDPALLRGSGAAVFTGAEEALDWIAAGRDPDSWGWIPRAEEWIPRLVGKTEGAYATASGQEPTHPS
jgi:nickel-dependent lactate racemase